jgi:hypothetical protein
LTDQQATDCDLFSLCYGTFSEMITARIEQHIDERSAAGEFEQDFRKQSEEDEEQEDAEELGQVSLF